ncbi:MAG: DnaD domain protein [Clostridia bacterium]|nr:DnaD domain protein [Clostridia bacterium]
MAFCTFSKEVGENSFTFVENKFILKYLPEANDFAVKVYLYGLYLCQSSDGDFSARSMAEVLKTTEGKILDAFEYWQDYDVVEILCKDPLTVQYLPVRAASGKPKKIRYDKYADFNKELQKKMQKVGKFVSYNESVKFMHFLDENDIQPMAFLMIAEYCIAKQGEAVSVHYIFNKAKKFIASGITTYEQVERALGNYNEHEKELSALFTLLSISRKIDESDYAAYQSWLDKGFEKNAIKAAAKHMKKGSMNGLQLLLEELAEKEKFTASEAETYLLSRDALSNLTFRIARKLGVKVTNPATYIDEYVEKWFDFGFEESSLLDIALFCLKTNRGDFANMNEQVRSLFSQGIIGKEAVKEFLKTKNADLRLLSKIQEYCGTLRASENNLALLKTWREWNFTDEMILEAAKRSASSAAPVPYINKILSEWKRAGYTSLTDLEKEEKPAVKPSANNYQTAAIDAVNAKADREKFYAERREKAQSVADRFIAKANKNARFKELTAMLAKMNMELAKAEIYAPQTLGALQEKQAAMQAEREAILREMGIEEWQLKPQYACKKCSDTGFLKSGAACDCYRK